MVVPGISGVFVKWTLICESLDRMTELDAWCKYLSADDGRLPADILLAAAHIISSQSASGVWTTPAFDCRLQPLISCCVRTKKQNVRTNHQS